MAREAILAIAIAIAIAAAPVPAHSTPLPAPRSAPLSLHLPGQIPISGYGMVDAFPEVRFADPVALVTVPGETNRLFVVERAGRIFVITNLASPTKTLFLDLSARVLAEDTEAGLLGLAFHPNHQVNGRFFVYWTGRASTPGSPNQFHDVVSRYEVRADDPNAADPTTEAVLLAQYDESTQHNAGDLKFGPDGYLYISVGERYGRDQSAPDQTPIDRDLLGAILRIDVDERPENPAPNPHPAHLGHYRIPADNPFIGASNHHGLAVNPQATRTELYAIGLRNPWRMAFDRVSSNLWVADVGANRHEEMNLVRPGRDYGWPYREGPDTLGYTPPPVFAPEPATYSYVHGWGRTNGDCIVGGMVYQGSALPLAPGSVVFGDFRSGHLWALQHDGTNTSVQRLTGMTIGLSTFGPDPRDDGILAAHLFDGSILKMVHRASPAPSDPPTSLGEIGIFADLVSLQPNPGIVPFEINAPFWSDHAIKRRWFAVPDPAETIGFESAGAWKFPTGTVWIKHFEMELTNGVPESARRLETRLLVNSAEGFYGLTYRWDASQTNAWLVGMDGEDEQLTIRAPDGSIVREQSWRYPSRSDCMNCHTKWGGRALGFTTAQLNRDLTYDGGLVTNQISALTAAGYVRAAPPQLTDLPALAPASDAAAPVEFRVRSFLQANCSACHVPGGPGFASWDARLSVPLPSASIVGPNHIVQPRDVAHSILAQRLKGFPWIMPPIGTSVQNTNAQNLIAQWIAHLPPTPWSYGPIGTPIHHGGSLASNEVYVVGGTGHGWLGTNDAFEFLRQPAAAPVTDWIVRLTAQDGAADNTMAGLMLRWSDEPGAPFAQVGIRKNGGAGFVHRLSTNAEPQVAWGDGTWALPRWLRLTRRDHELSAAHSADGTNWLHLGTAAIPPTPPATTSAIPVVGLAAHSSSSTAFNQAVFDQFSQVSVSLTSSVSGTVQQPVNVALAATVTTQNQAMSGVEFFDGSNRLGEARSAPFQWTVTNIWSGPHQFTAHAIDHLGNRLVSRPVDLTVLTRPTGAFLIGLDATNRGLWPGAYGSEGFLIARHATNLAAHTTVSFPGVDHVTWSGNTRDARALRKTNSTLGIAAAWRSVAPLSIAISLRHGAGCRVSFYFLDWNNNNRRVQRVEFLDSSGTPLASEVVSNFSGGIYLSAELRGEVTVRIERVEGTDAVLSGIFFDELDIGPREITITRPFAGEGIPLPAHGVVEAQLSGATNVQSVEFHFDGHPVGRVSQAPYVLDLGPLMEGTHTIFARATDVHLDTFDSAPTTFTALLPTSRATFLFEDGRSRGNWIGKYGQDGFLLPPFTNRWPDGFAHSLFKGGLFPTLGDVPDYLQNPAGGSRVDPLMFGYENVEWLLNLPDGHARRLSLYFQDGAAFAQVVSAFDAVSGKLLDRRSVTNGQGGRYLAWNVQGDLMLQVSNPAPGHVQSRLNGVFLDPITGPAPEVSLLQPFGPFTNPTPARILLAASAQSPDGVRRVEFHTAESLVDEVTAAPYETVWHAPIAGDHRVFARAVALEGAVADSAPVSLRIEFTTPALARFMGADTNTAGNWINNYGREGYWIPSQFNYVKLPSWASLTLTQEWSEFGFQALPQALSTPRGYERIMSFWRGDAWSFRARFEDGLVHRLSLYNFALGWTNAVSIRVRAADTGAELDQRRLETQSVATYLTWEIQGDVIFEFNASDGTFAFVNGLFVDAVPDPFGDWQRRHFRGSQLLDPILSGFGGDPDRDGFINWSEYLLGRDPVSADEPSPFRLERSTNGLHLHLRLASATDPASVRFEVSGDLQLWQTLDSPFPLVQASDADGRTERIYRLPVPDDVVRFFRLQLPPAP